MQFFKRLCLSLVAALILNPAQAGDEPFKQWLAGVYEEAQQKGISQSLLDTALGDLSEPDGRVIDLDRKQPETKFTLGEYLERVLPQSRKDKAHVLYQEHRELLEKIGREYGVQPRFIVALWGIESNFGERMGEFSIVHSLATLAYDGRRSAYFRQELMNALEILQQAHITPAEMIGSWAGAMGQCQFMPTSFINYAVDYNGDGHKDIWNTEADVFASIAHYLKSEGWNGEKGWGSAKHPADNFNVLLKWNRSRYFATAVGMLADSIVAPKAGETPKPKKAKTKTKLKTKSAIKKGG